MESTYYRDDPVAYGHHMAKICIENVPPESQIGLNLHSWQSGPNFRGLRDVPAGTHCLHVTISGIVTTKFAAWLDLAVDSSYAFQWDKQAQELRRIDSAYSSSVNHMFLLECPQEEDREWSSISSHITPELLATIIPAGIILSSTTTSNTDQTAADLENLAQTDTSSEASFQFTVIDLKRSWRPGAVGREVTQASLDKSWLLGNVLQNVRDSKALLGEFEFCFLSVLLYTSVTAFDQWHIILRLFCSSKDALVIYGDLFLTLLQLLQAQMQQVSNDLYSDIFSLVLPRQLRSLRSNLLEIKEDRQGDYLQNLEDELDVCTDFLTREFGIEDDEHLQQQVMYPVDDVHDQKEVSEEDEDAPTIVEL